GSEASSLKRGAEGAAIAWNAAAATRAARRRVLTVLMWRTGEGGSRCTRADWSARLCRHGCFGSNARRARLRAVLNADRAVGANPKDSVHQICLAAKHFDHQTNDRQLSDLSEVAVFEEHDFGVELRGRGELLKITYV